jgi:hypothetical protein
LNKQRSIIREKKFKIILLKPIKKINRKKQKENKKKFAQDFLLASFLRLKLSTFI